VIYVTGLTRRASCVSVGSLAAQLVQTPALAVDMIAELLREASGIKVRSSRAMLMNVIGRHIHLLPTDARKRGKRDQYACALDAVTSGRLLIEILAGGLTQAGQIR
jgi:hypothetical protein